MSIAHVQETLLMDTTTLVYSNVSNSMRLATFFAYLVKNSSMVSSPNSTDKRGSKTALMDLATNSPFILLSSIESSTSSWRFASQPMLKVLNVWMAKDPSSSITCLTSSAVAPYIGRSKKSNFFSSTRPYKSQRINKTTLFSYCWSLESFKFLALASTKYTPQGSSNAKQHVK